eukprot:CAMPEP_0201488058 /NCGR_PEP_ID=MMETSP0151_2-20130828/16614_1 /ASSEMBLY_ACC=CAM_ASM_000257 /TAXON_ID=200890 /ORGANISM="Paramoeba atlantica, Strain 621/1 / CCAP 1560/9" /LENGTH=170 /DNA_ID=CAMNT_0047873273 /DNA_START=23 /DNA_END=535 /DNA_ORIENTATION=+
MKGALIFFGLFLSLCAAIEIRYVEIATTDTFIHPNGETDNVVGTYDVFENELFEAVGGEKVGEHAGICFILNFLDKWSCHWTVNYPDNLNQINLAGVIWNDPGQVAQIAVVGGTGEFENAHGQGNVTSDGDFSTGTNWVFSLDFETTSPASQLVGAWGLMIVSVLVLLFQ